MKKGISLLLVAMLAILVMAACTPAATPTEAPATEPPATEPPATETEVAGGDMPEACATEGACAVFAAGEVIKIGFGGPMTGDNSAFGIDASQGAALALKDAGELEGHAFELAIEDDQGTGDGGAAAANKLAADPAVVAVVGHSFSGATNNAMPIYAEANIPMMSPSATRVDLTTLGNAAFNRVIATDKIQGAVATPFIMENLGKTKVAILHDGTPYGQGIAEVVQANVTEAGGEVVAFEALTPGETDYSAVLNQIAAASPEAVFFGGYQPEAAVLANQKAAANLGDVPFVSGDGVAGSDFLNAAGDNAEGYYVTNGAPPAESDARAAFDAAYLAEYGTEAGTLSGYTWHGYDAAAILITAIKKLAVVGGDGTLYIDRAALVAEVRATTDFPGITATISCDEVGECGSSANFAVFVVTGGAFEQLAADFKPE
jgi:branched-chain amino acid transport system substrate-binding protein